MANIGICTDTSDLTELFAPQNLYLKQIARINVSVQLPQIKTPGKSISNWEIMEKLKKIISPDLFLFLKVAKSTMEFVRFEGEIESKNKLGHVLGRLDGKLIKLSGFPESLKVRAAEAKCSFPLRHDWEAFFRDAKNMNEMKPGERPDTVHLKDLPSKWFLNRRESDSDQPSEYILKKVFETFGEVRCVDIPMLDPYRKEMTTTGAIQTFKFDQDIVFEAFVQFKEYIGFVKSMSALKGMKLAYKCEDGKALAATIKVDFDCTKHMTDKNIKKRRLERERLMKLEEERELRVRREREAEEQRREEERRKKEQDELDKIRKKEDKMRKKEERRREREEKRRLKRLEKKRKEEEKAMHLKIAVEERRILIAQRKLETIRLLAELFNRVKVIKQAEEVERRERELEQEQRCQAEQKKRQKLEEEKRKLEAERKRHERLQRQEQELRNKILKNMRLVEEKKAEKQREELRKKIAGSKKLRSVMVKK